MITDKELLKFIKENCEKLGITGYDIGRNTPITEQAAYRILNGTTKNPRRKNLLEIVKFLETKIIGSAVPGHENYNQRIEEEANSKKQEELKKFNEPGPEYYRLNKDETIELMKKQIASLEKEMQQLRDSIKNKKAD